MTTVVMTGGTSGFGLHAANQLRAGGSRLLVGARGHGAATATATDALALDLASLASVRSFAEQVHQRLAERPVDALVLNAGIVRRDATSRSADDYELTFAVNHLAHYLVVRLLWDLLAPGAVVVLTTSGTHDPATGTGLTPPRHANAFLLADPSTEPGAEPGSVRAGEHAYTASKLATVMTARVLAARQDARDRRLTILAVCPGQVFGTGLATDLSLPRRVAWTVMGTPVSAPLRRFVPTLNTRKAAGSVLASLSLGQAAAPEGRTYAALRRGRLTWPDPSVLARDETASAAMWADSATLVGLSP